MKTIIILFILLSIPLALSEEVHFGVGDSVTVTVVRFHNETQNATLPVNESQNATNLNETQNIETESLISGNNYNNEITELNNQTCEPSSFKELFFEMEKCKSKGIKLIWVAIISLSLIFICFYVYKLGQRKDLNTLNSLNN